MSVRSDAELALAWRAGDRTAFADVYEKYSASLYGVAMGLVRDRTAASDVVHDTFVRAARRIEGLREPDRLRAWLFAILRNEATDWHRRQGRESADDVAAMSEMLAADLPEPHTELSRSELSAVVWTAAGALQQRDREVLELHLRAGLEAGDLADALGVTAGHAAVLLSRMRDRMEKAIGALLIARQGRRDCTGLDTLLASWDGRFTLDIRSKVTRHVESCPVCTRGRMQLASYARLAPAVLPVFLVPDALRREVLTSFDLVSDQLTHGQVPTGQWSPEIGGYADGPGGPGADSWSWRADGFPAPQPAGPSATVSDAEPDEDLASGPAAATAAGFGAGRLATATEGQGPTQLLPPMPPLMPPSVPQQFAGEQFAGEHLPGEHLPYGGARLPPPPPPGGGPSRGLVLIGILLAVVLGIGVGAWKMIISPAANTTSPSTSTAGTTGATGATGATGDPTMTATQDPTTQTETSSPTTSSSPTSSTTTSPTSTTTTTTTTATAPAAMLEISAAALDFGSGEPGAVTTRSLTLSNTGGQSLTWTASASGNGFSVTPGTGSIAAGKSATLTVTLTRPKMADGSVTGMVALASSTTGQSGQVSLSGSVANAPMISNLKVPYVGLRVPAAACAYPMTAQVSVDVSDTNGIVSVIMQWNNGGGTMSTPMAGGQTYTAPIGPFLRAGSYPLTVTATDSRGKTATTTGSVTVTCTKMP
ncbi:MAG TPA: sigma-70 family RNA polymerase sigma factor [Kineosporiaceae bacterium]|nr:sigma-70 family RNA polymerase sigma factor [Kineosporiaceae bacterium]